MTTREEHAEASRERHVDSLMRDWSWDRRRGEALAGWTSADVLVDQCFFLVLQLPETVVAAMQGRSVSELIDAPELNCTGTIIAAENRTDTSPWGSFKATVIEADTPLSPGRYAWRRT